MQNMTGFTNEQINNFSKYEKVRKLCKFNMFSSSAQIAAGLTSREMFFCIEHYDELKAVYTSDIPTH